jgi:anti-sigma-K factor RskA
VNIKEYISSGIVESYVLGIADAADRQEFEQLCAQYPELLAARNDFELALEKIALDNAVIPPAEVKERIFEAFQTVPSITKSKVITMQNSNSQKSSGNRGFLVAACVILLAGLAWFVYNSYAQSKQLKDLQAKMDAQNSELNTKDSLLNKIKEEQKMVAGNDVTVVNMVGTQAAPRSSANVYWDSTTTDVFLVVKNMPKLPSDQQYQLWSLIGGKPDKSLGTFDGKVNNENIILKMTNVKKADAFAITIEKQGGAPSPTLEKLQSVGKTKESL